MKKMLCVLVVLCLVGAASADMVAYYNFEEGSGVVAADSSGYGNAANGSFVGSGISWVAGKVGNSAVSLDGTSWINCGNDVKFDISSQITIAAWVKSDVNGAWRMWLSKGNTAGWRSCQVDNSNKMFFGVRSDEVNMYSDTTVLDGTWHHVACTYDGAEIRMYVDGALDVNSHAGSGAIGVNTYNVLIGGNEEYTPGTWNGQIDEVRIYNQALTEAEVKALVPEPATMALLGLGALGLLRKRR